MKQFFATVTYRTRRGNLGRWDGPIDAKDFDDAIRKARVKVASRVRIARFDMIHVLTAHTPRDLRHQRMIALCHLAPSGFHG